VPRVILFIDYQNMYRDAQEAFFGKNSHYLDGQFDPVALANLICSRRPFGAKKETRELAEVRLYTGRPVRKLEPKSHSAFRRQQAAWEEKGIRVSSRRLQYLDWPKNRPRQKGVDVALAVDFVVMACEGEYDIGVIASTDTDLLPALEYVSGTDAITAEVAAWWGEAETTRKQLRVTSRSVWCHRLLRNDYDAVSDTIDYSIP
jgi:uncharacterized LabA/DUF88 family protein